MLKFGRRVLWLALLLVFASLTADAQDKLARGKLSYALDRLARAAERGEELSGRGLRYLEEDSKQVSAVIVLAPGATAPELDGILRAAGGSRTAASGNLVKVKLPPESLRGVSHHPQVLRMRTPYYANRKVVSQGVAAMRADEFVSRKGVDGTGVAVAILDTGFARASSLIGSELPDNTVATDWVLERLNQFDDAHGTACAEIVHDVAPGAELLLAGFEGDEVSWAAALDELMGAGVNIISHSIGFDNIAPPDGNNFFAQKADQVAAAGILLVTAAGNEGEKYFQGRWRDSNANNYMEFGDTEFLPIQNLPGGSQVVLRWDDTFGRSNHDYDLYVVKPAFLDNPDFTSNAAAVVASSEELQSGSQDPVEIVQYNSSEELLYVVIRHDPASPLNGSQRFWVWAGDGIGEGFRTASGTLSLPGDARGALTVGAVYFGSLALESFSSQGPTSDGRTKPDLAAPDGVSTASDGEFFGTSAATPHAAGAAALLLSANPSFNFSRLRQALEEATSSGRGRKDNQVGYGPIDLSRAR
jgi:subtilisin family serine protease